MLRTIAAALAAFFMLAACTNESGEKTVDVVALIEGAAALHHAVCTEMERDHPARRAARAGLAKVSGAVAVVQEIGFDPYCADSGPDSTFVSGSKPSRVAAVKQVVEVFVAAVCMVAPDHPARVVARELVAKLPVAVRTAALLAGVPLTCPGPSEAA